MGRNLFGPSACFNKLGLDRNVPTKTFWFCAISKPSKKIEEMSIFTIAQGYRMTLRSV